jgi:hypothetical protein
MECHGCKTEFYVAHENNARMTPPEEVAALENKFEKLTNVAGKMCD